MQETTREKWAKRVRRWKESGLTAREYGSEIGVRAGTLTYWNWRLKQDTRAGVKKRPSKARAPKPTKHKANRTSAKNKKAPVMASSFVEVVSPLLSDSAGIEVLTDAGHIVRLSIGFDADTFRRAMEALR